MYLAKDPYTIVERYKVLRSQVLTTLAQFNFLTTSLSEPLTGIRKNAWSFFPNDPTTAICPITGNTMIRDDGTTWHASHIFASSKGGSDAPSNLRPLAPEVNRAMSDTHMHTYILKNYGLSAVERLHLKRPCNHNTKDNLKSEYKP